MRIAVLAALGLLTATAPVAAQQDFEWTGRIAQGGTLEIRGVNGAIRAVPAGADRVVVQADRSGRRSDPESVRIEVVEHPGGVTVCAVYPTPSGARRENECRPGGGENSVRDNDVRVNFVVQVPAGVHFEAVTVNGAVEAEGLDGDVRARTVNGDVDVRTAGFAEARTVNGSVTARLGTSRFSDDVEFETVNGSITVDLPAGLDADFRASTVNGSIESDFPITVTGKVSRRSLRGTIGAGGPELRVSTVNGSIRLRRI